MFPEKWYLKPREIWEMAKIGMHLVTNMIITALPVSISEPLMTTLNPALKKRSVVKNYDPASYQLCDWDENETKNLILRLKTAREERKSTGAFNVFTDGAAIQATESAAVARPVVSA